MELFTSLVLSTSKPSSMLRTIALLILTWPTFFTAIACYNETHINKNGKVTGRSEPFFGFYDSPDTARATAFIANHDLSKIHTYDVDTQSDLAVNFAYLGRYKEALTILRRLYKENPGNYNVVANLGTTYELTGKNDSALLFIKKSLAIDPESHAGSEWVHVKILEAKLNMAKDPNWLLKNSVLQTGVTAGSAISDDLVNKALDIEYQLKERVPFTPFPDAILANVFNELGDLLATQLSVEHAYIAYDFALQYGAVEQYGVQQKMDELKRMLRKEKIILPSWRAYYHNRQSEKNINDVVETVTKVVAENKDIVSGFYDQYKERQREKERIKRRNNLLIGGGAFLVAITGFFVWMRRKK